MEGIDQRMVAVQEVDILHNEVEDGHGNMVLAEATDSPGICSNADRCNALVVAHFQLDAINIHAHDIVVESVRNICTSMPHFHPANKESQEIHRRDNENTEIRPETEGFE